MPQVRAYACDDARSQYHPMMIDIREPGPGEVLFDIKYAVRREHQACPAAARGCWSRTESRHCR